jgi:hypothetical protein
MRKELIVFSLRCYPCVCLEELGIPRRPSGYSVSWPDPYEIDGKRLKSRNFSEDGGCSFPVDAGTYPVCKYRQPHLPEDSIVRSLYYDY